jgi:predicted phage tail protein
MGYNLDDTGNTTVDGNFTLNNLVTGAHTLTVYAIDTYGTSGASKSVNFTVENTTPRRWHRGNLLAVGTDNSACSRRGISVNSQQRWACCL